MKLSVSLLNFNFYVTDGTIRLSRTFEIMCKWRMGEGMN